MLEQFIIAGLSGVLIMFCIYGLAILVRILNDHRDRGMNWKSSFKNNVKDLKSWIAVIFISLFILMIIIGILGGIFNG